MGDNAPILYVEGLKISFPKPDAFTAVDGISFTIDKGKTLAVVGESGSGKSLTALALMGLLPKNAAQAGNITLTKADNKSVSLNWMDSRAWQQVRGKEIGMVFQEPMSSLNPVMQAGRQLAEAIMAGQGISAREAQLQAIEWLGRVQLPNPGLMYGRYPHQLSGGQKQRVMIAMAMCNHPVLLIADEPTTALDATVQQEVVRLMAYLQQQYNTAMIFITHDLALAATIADEVMVMYKGQVMEYGDAQQVLQAPKHPYTQALIACKPTAGQKGKQLPVVADFLDADKSRASAVITSRPLGDIAAVGGKLLEVKDLRVWFVQERNMLGKITSYFKAVDNVSFTLNKGEVLGLVGESGCGKSTLSRSLIGLTPIHSGQILYNHQDLVTLHPREWNRVRTDIQMIFQDPYASLNPRLTIGDAIMEPMLVHGIVERREVRREALRLLDLVQLPAEALEKYPHQFSGGQRQRIGIARALALRPQLLICDESVSALDVSIQAQILNLLKDLQREFDLTYLFISHDLAVVHYISDRVMVMQAGKIVESGEAEQVLKQPENSYTRRLIEAMP